MKNAEEYLDIIFFRSINIVIRFVRNRKLLGMMGERTKEQDGGKVLGKSLTFPLDGTGGFSFLGRKGGIYSVLHEKQANLSITNSIFSKTVLQK